METVKLAVEVERAQLDTLQRDVAGLRSSTLNVKVDTKGVSTANVEVQRLGKSMDSAAKSANSLASEVLKFTKWYVIGNTVSSMVRSLKDAVETMKAVDDQLVTVRKVTGATTEELKQLEKQAYNVATAYGTAVDAFIETEAAFARAGYRDNIEELAELSTKTQLVGDMTAQVANQFLLSVDAAYKYKGAVEDLNHVIDAANELDNRYATSMEKIADGMGIVAPVAAQLGVSVDELMAMLGTITAVTQRSGSEAARALRSILINLTNDVNATFQEVNGEITFAISEIDGLSDVVKLYAKDLYDTAQATGKILNPTEILEALVKAAEEGRLTEQKLYDLVTTESGKMRAAQLWALIQNWNTMYKDMLADTASAVGSADREVENALNSWSRKVEQLKNSWANLVAAIVDTDLVKGGITELIYLFDDLARSMRGETQLDGLTMAKWTEASNAIKKYKKIVGDVEAEKAWKKENEELMRSLSKAVAEYEKNGVDVGQRWKDLKYSIDAIIAPTANAKVAIDTVSSALREFQSEGELSEETTQSLENAIPGLIEALYDEEGQLGSAGRAALTAADSLSSARSATEYLQATANVFSLQQAINEIDRLTSAAMTATEKAAYLQSLFLKIGGLDSSGRMNIDGRAVAAAIARGEATDLNDYLNQLLDKERAKIAGLFPSTTSSYSYSTPSTSSSSSKSSSSGSTKDTELERLKQIVADEKARYALMEAQKKSAADLARQVSVIQGALHNQAEYMRAIGSDYADVAALSKEWYEWEAKKSKVDQSYADKVAALKNQLSFLEESNASEDERIAKMREIQNALHEEAEYLRSIKADEEDIRKLSTEWWTWQNKIQKLLDDTAAAAEKAAEAQRKAALEAKNAAVTYAKNQLSLLKALGVGNAELSGGARKVSEAYLRLLEYQQEIGADQNDLLTTLIAYVGAKQDELDLQQKIREESEQQLEAEKERAEQQKKLDLQYLSDTAALWGVEVELAKKLGYSTEEQLALMRKHAEAIAAQGRWMEANGASQLEINQLALQYLGVLEDIYQLENTGENDVTDAQANRLKDLKSVVALRESELKLMQAMGRGEDEQERKYREIMDATEAVGEYMQEIGESQTDINDTATSWYNTLRKVLSLQKDSLSELTDEALAYIDEQEEKAISPLQEQLDLLKEQRNAVKEARTEEEKRLAVEKARIALENAQRQRTVRTYNAQSGQWEWVANAKDVMSAEQSLIDANADLSEYLAERAYQEAVHNLELQIDYTKKTFSALRDAIKTASKAIADGKYTYEEAYAYISSQMHEIYDKYGVDLTNVMNTAVGGFRGVALQVEATYREIEQAALAFGDLNGIFRSSADDIKGDLDGAKAKLSLAFGGIGLELDNADYQVKAATEKLKETVSVMDTLPDAVRELINKILSMEYEAGDDEPDDNGNNGADKAAVINQMMQNSIAWGGASAYEQQRLDAENQRLGASIGLYRNAQGYWIDPATGKPAYDVRAQTKANAIAAMKVNSQKWHSADAAERQRLADENQRIGRQMGFTYDSATGTWWENGVRLYDRGGILNGMGGIKATNEDEAILGPDTTRKLVSQKGSEAVDGLAALIDKMTNSALFGTTRAVMAQSGIVTGSRGGDMITPAGNVTNNSSNTTNYNVNIAGVDLRNVSSGMTLGELCDAARTLPLH